MREIALEVPRIRWSDVGGLDDVKQRLQEAVQWPQQHSSALARLGAQVIHPFIITACHFPD